MSITLKLSDGVSMTSRSASVFSKVPQQKYESFSTSENTGEKKKERKDGGGGVQDRAIVRVKRIRVSQTTP